MTAMDFNAAVERARARLETEYPRRHLTWRARLHHWYFGVWPAEVVAENWNRAKRFEVLVEYEVGLEVRRWRRTHA